MDHIHNLVIIDVAFMKGDVYVSTNSIHNALFARTCMLSRSAFKGTRIEWAPDECEGPSPHAKTPVRKAPVAASQSKKVGVLANRFGCLNTDGTEDGFEEDENYVRGSKENIPHSPTYGGVSLAQS